VYTPSPNDDIFCFLMPPPPLYPRWLVSSFRVSDLTFSTPKCTHALREWWQIFRVCPPRHQPSPPPRTPLYYFRADRAPRERARAHSIHPAAKDNDQVLCSPNRRSSSSSCIVVSFSAYFHYSILHAPRAIIFGRVPRVFSRHILFIILFFFLPRYERACCEACACRTL